MTDENEDRDRELAESEARWRERQEAYRRALQEWRICPAATDDDPRAEARDRNAKLREADRESLSDCF